MSVFAIIVTYNGAPWVHACLGSLRASTLPVQTIVVDNGSTDGTPDLIGSAFPEVELVRTGKNLGFGAANNVGIRMALDRGAGHVFLLNQDAWVQPDTLGLMVEASTAYPEYGVLSPMHLNGTGTALDDNFSSYIIPARCPGLYSDLVLGHPHDAPYPVQFVNAAAWLITRHCLETVGGFNPSFPHYGEDKNYLHRAHFHGFKAGVLPTAWIYHDRENRKENPYFSPDVVERRHLREMYADPGRNLDLKQELSRLRSLKIRYLFSLQRTAAHVAHRQVKLLSEAVDEQVINGRELSRHPGPTFL